MLLTFTINKQLIRRTDCEIPVAKSENYLRAKFTASEEWQKPITAIFNNGTPFSVLLDDNNECMIPWEVITASGFSVSAFCGDRITANSAFVMVLPSGYIEGETPSDPTPTVYEQILDELDDKLEPSNIKAGQNVTVAVSGNDVTISATGGSGDAYTKAETDALLADKQDKGDYATETALGAEETARQNADASLQLQINAKADAATTYTKTETNTLLNAKADASALADYATTAAMNTALAAKVDINQGAANVGKVMTVGADGSLSPQNAQGGMHDYSTDEQVVGTWIDGKPLYEKTIEIAKSDVLNQATQGVKTGSYISTGLSFGMCRVIAAGYQFFANKDVLAGSPTLWNADGSYISMSAEHNFNNYNGNIVFYCSTVFYYEGGWVTIQYTKTTDTAN